MVWISQKPVKIPRRPPQPRPVETTQPEARDWPEPCVKCGIEAKFRKICDHCGEAQYVMEHQGTHYMGGGVNEVIPCRCGRESALERGKRAQAKKRKRAIRDGRLIPKPGVIKTAEQARQVAQDIVDGKTVKAALLRAGAAESSANRGKLGLNNLVWDELRKISQPYIETAKALTAEEQELIVRGKLLESTLTNNDKGVQAAKQLGADKRVSMWQADSQVGMIVLQAPPVPKIDHEVPWIKVGENLPTFAPINKDSDKSGKEGA